MLGLVRDMEKDSKKPKQQDQTISLDLRIQLRDNIVRIVHKGGRQELYHDIIRASQVMEKYPGMCVARPEVFKCPLQSLISAEEYLIPGYKYYLIPSTTAEKLKHRYLRKMKMKQLSYNSEEPLLAIKDVADVGAECSDESVCSAKDFYVSRERWSTCSQRKYRKEKRPFVPPIQKPRVRKELEWEPSLTCIEEESP